MWFLITNALIVKLHLIYDLMCIVLAWRGKHSMLVVVQYLTSSSLIFLNVKGTSFNDTFVICSMNLHTSLTYGTLQIMFIQQTHTHQQMCCIYSREFDRFVFHPLYKLYRVTSIPHICSAHGKAHQRPSFFSSAWKHQPLSLSLHFCPRPWRERVL